MDEGDIETGEGSSGLSDVGLDRTLLLVDRRVAIALLVGERALVGHAVVQLELVWAGSGRSVSAASDLTHRDPRARPSCRGGCSGLSRSAPRPRAVEESRRTNEVRNALGDIVADEDWRRHGEPAQGSERSAHRLCHVHLIELLQSLDLSAVHVPAAIRLTRCLVSGLSCVSSAWIFTITHRSRKRPTNAIRLRPA